MNLRPVVFLFLSTAVSACSSSSNDSVGANDGGVVSDAAADASSDATVTTDGATTNDAGGPYAVTFSYTPDWMGVTAVDVIGGFGLSTDWTTATPLVSLTANGATFSGSAMLPAGQYLYVLRAVGDAAGGGASATLVHFAVDPSTSAFAPCPAQSPTYSAIDENPCSQLTVPQGSTPTLNHATGTVLVDGAPASGYIALLERDETGSHHFFVNRTTTGTDGSFDIASAAGTYRFQVLYPTYYSATDATRDPLALPALRRAISSTFSLAAAVAVPSPDLAFHDYAAFSPTGDGGTLPTELAFGGDGGIATRLTVYGTAMDGGGGEIGDPWFSGADTRDGGAVFGGTFNTAQADQDAAVPGERYFWGIENGGGAPDAGVAWTGQSMVFPITWQP
jgi:hypothetical protein